MLHIFKCIYIYFILQAVIEADTHVSIILLICSIVESFYILNDVILEKSTSQAKVFFPLSLNTIFVFSIYNNQKMIPSSTYFLTKFANLYGSHSGQSRRKYRKIGIP